MDTHPVPPKMIRVNISLSAERLAKLDRLATDAARTRSNTIARWIDGAKDPK
jgi:metal-responsive CopG/Arc/MetJ family transcriptional regulator